MDTTVRLWDLAAGKSMGTLTHHKKSVRALAAHPLEWTFASASPGTIKRWRLPDAALMTNMQGQNSIINCMAVNEDGVLFSGGECLCKHFLQMTQNLTHRTRGQWKHGILGLAIGTEIPRHGNCCAAWITRVGSGYFLLLI